MDDVAEILSGHYGIRQQGKSAPMAASKHSNTSTFSTWDDQTSSSGKPSSLRAEKVPLSLSKKDGLLESLGLRLTEIEGLGYEELVNGGDVPIDPFLVFETDIPPLHQFSGKTNVISPAYEVDGSDSFDIFGGIGGSTSSFPSEGNRNIGNIRVSSADQNPSNAQKPLMDFFLDSYPNSSAPKPPILENFDFFRMYDLDEKEIVVPEVREEISNKSYSGIEAFFSDIGLGGRWPPTQMEETSEDSSYAPFEKHGGLGGAQKEPIVSNVSINESSSMKNMIGDLSFVRSHSKFEDFEGDNEYRRRAKHEQEQKKFARAARALAEKNEHDLKMQRERNEREIIAEELDFGVKKWAAGREGNLRALLSTLQDVLWPECGWQPVSLANLMTCTAVKKVYGRAALCIHPDKVQQKGSTIRQKYVAEKVFYILTEALSKFSSEELT